METGRRFTKRLLLIPVLTLLLSISATPSFASDSPPDTDWRLSGVVTTNNKITQGSSVTYSYEIKNVGNVTSFLYSPIFVYTPSEFTFSSYSTPTNFVCEYNGVITAEQAGPATYSIGRSKNYCYPNGNENSEYIYLDPGESTYFEIRGTANSDYTINTKSYSVYIYEVDPSLQQPYIDGVNIWETNSTNAINSAVYPYGVLQSQITTTTAKPSTDVKGNGLEATSGNSGGEEIGKTGSAVGSSESGSESQSKSNSTKAADIRDPKLNGLKSDKPQSWSEIFEQYKMEIVGSVIFVTIFAAAGTILIRRHRRKTQLQREYNHALALLNHRKGSPTEENFDEYKPNQSLGQTNETSIKRTKIHGRPVEMSSSQSSLHTQK